MKHIKQTGREKFTTESERQFLLESHEHARVRTQEPQMVGPETVNETNSEPRTTQFTEDSDENIFSFL